MELMKPNRRFLVLAGHASKTKELAATLESVASVAVCSGWSGGEVAEALVRDAATRVLIVTGFVEPELLRRLSAVAMPRQIPVIAGWLPDSFLRLARAISHSAGNQASVGLGSGSGQSVLHTGDDAAH